jgi:hypothetical protein
MRRESQSKLIEPPVCKLAAIYAPCARTIAKTFSGRRGEFAGTAEITVASLQIICLEAPYRFCGHIFCLNQVVFTKRGFDFILALGNPVATGFHLLPANVCC